MIRCAPKTSIAITSNVKFLSVGEWVEIDGDRSPGYNSEGGIAVIVAVHDDFADVKYVLTRRVEKLIPLRRHAVQTRCRHALQHHLPFALVLHPMPDLLPA